MSEETPKPEKFWPWQVDVALMGINHHLVYETEEAARAVYSILSGVMDGASNHKNDAPRTLEVKDATGAIRVSVAQVQAVRVTQQVEWRARAAALQEAEIEALERAKARGRAGADG